MAEVKENLTYAEWFAKGVELFGRDMMKWKFECPACGYVASAQDYKDAKAPGSVVAYSCIGRFVGAKRRAFGDTGPGPCDYAGGGLFNISPIIVGTPYFAFAQTGGGSVNAGD